jgi:Transmembrane domain of unknown function (DUF3566)
MTNRARPTWPDGAGSAKKSPEMPPGANGNGNGQPTPPTTSASNGRTPAPNGGTGSSVKGSSGNSGQGRPGTPAGQGPPSQQPRPAPGSAKPGPAAKPVRPPQQPPVRPVVKQAPSGPTATPRPGQVGPSTPQRPESRLPGQTPTKAPAGQAPTTAPPAKPTYGQYGKSSSTTETIADRVTAAKEAVIGKAAAVKEAATQGVDALSRQGDAGTGTKSAAKASTRPRTRKARLRLSRVDPWSVMKTAFLLSIAFGIVTWVAIFIVWSAIGAAGVFDNINSTVNQVLGSPSAEPFRIENYINTRKVMGFTTLLACADVLIITALATLGSFLYNIAATLLGGLEVTLASED